MFVCVVCRSGPAPPCRSHGWTLLLQLNGVVTQDENIADSGGLRLAYRAYRRLAASGPPMPLLPDCPRLRPGGGGGPARPPAALPLRPQQLFWLTAANVWCSADRVEHLRNTVLDSEHVPNRFRVNGPLSNMAEFAADFGCRPGAPMSPPDERRCRVW